MCSRKKLDKEHQAGMQRHVEIWILSCAMKMKNKCLQKSVQILLQMSDLNVTESDSGEIMVLD